MKKLIKKIVDLAYSAKEGHIPSALSILDIVYVLYTKVMKEDDVFVLSKGHGCLAHYVVLNEVGKISDEQLNSFCQYGSQIGGHPSRNEKIGVTTSTGSLGHGLPMAVGIAYAKKVKNEPGNVYCIVGDQECNEGSIWESFLLAKEYALKNLTVIIDNNKSGSRSICMDDILLTLGSDLFRFDIHNPNGHNHHDLLTSFDKKNYYETKIIVADTIKGKGINMMSESPFEWHHRVPNEDEYQKIMEELDIE